MFLLLGQYASGFNTVFLTNLGFKNIPGMRSNKRVPVYFGKVNTFLGLLLLLNVC